MTFMRSVLLTVGVVLTASLIATAAAPPKTPASPVGAKVASPKSPVLPVSPVSPKSPGSPASGNPGSTQSNQANTVITPDVLAIVDSVFSYCAQVDRSSASNYQSAVAMFTQGHAAAETAALRRTPEYAKAQAEYNVRLESVSYASGITACRSFSTSNRKIGTSSPIRTPTAGSF